MFNPIFSGFQALASLPSQYFAVNKSNLFNYLIFSLSRLPHEEQREQINLLRLHMGLTFTDGFKKYVERKMPGSSLLSLLYATPTSALAVPAPAAALVPASAAAAATGASL